MPVFSGLPFHPIPSGEVIIGSVLAGSSLDFYLKTEIGGTFWAFSADMTTESAQTAFRDLDDSLGLGGSVISEVGPGTWILHLDDAASFDFDDDDNDVLIRVRLDPAVGPEPMIPEPSAAIPAGLAVALVLAFVRRRRSH